MSDEIKEILEILKKCYDLKDEHFDNYISLYQLGLLLDYITNLQEENNKLKNLKYKFFDCSGDEESFTLNDYLEIGNKTYDLQEENERLIAKNLELETLCDTYEEEHNNEFKIWKDERMQLIDYKSRIDKAIKYMEQYTDKLKTFRIPKIDFNYSDLLNILGGDKE